MAQRLPLMEMICISLLQTVCVYENRWRVNLTRVSFLQALVAFSAFHAGFFGPVAVGHRRRVLLGFELACLRRNRRQFIDA